MCGRYTLDVSIKEMDDYLKNTYQIEEWNRHIKLPRYNVAPGQEILAVLHDGTRFRAGTLKWGLVPFFAKDEKSAYKMINAKSETLAEKPSFKQLLASKRCIILADSFYEWQKNEGGKQAMRIQLNSKKIFSFAGLWSVYKKQDGSHLYTCTIITTTPNQVVAPIHDRMPVILTEEAKKLWLDPSIKDSQILTNLLNPYSDLEMSFYPVSQFVNSTRNDGPDCILPFNA